MLHPSRQFQPHCVKQGSAKPTAQAKPPNRHTELWPHTHMQHKAASSATHRAHHPHMPSWSIAGAAAAATFPYATTHTPEQSLSSFRLHHARVRCMHRLVTNTLGHSSKAATRTEQTQIHNQPTHQRVESIHLSPHMQPNLFGRNRDSRAARADIHTHHPSGPTMGRCRQGCRSTSLPATSRRTNK